ncbi:hypothetical protein M9H77_25143 [Catharanthus roseus]|uniref:Uncharacterized protein n=1 Tax=Catharanthus roseus TaxID=4058 RepID=A0ACC0A647_CATRO|nr:hypothetical protein M9H77_25143 [Catharanthus roseus]
MTKELKPKGHKTRKRTPSSGNATQLKVTKKTGEQQRGIEHRKREESSGEAEESEGKPRVSKTPKDREWRDGSEEESKRLPKNRSNNSNKKRRRAVHLRVAKGWPGWPTRTAQASF